MRLSDRLFGTEQDVLADEAVRLEAALDLLSEAVENGEYEEAHNLAAAHLAALDAQPTGQEGGF